MNEKTVIVTASRCIDHDEPWVPSTKEHCHTCKCEVWVSDVTKQDVAILIADGTAGDYVAMCIPCVLELKDVPEEIYTGGNTTAAVIDKILEEEESDECQRKS
jgi:hypothetical protein